MQFPLKHLKGFGIIYTFLLYLTNYKSIQLRIGPNTVVILLAKDQEVRIASNQIDTVIEHVSIAMCSEQPKV